MSVRVVVINYNLNWSLIKSRFTILREYKLCNLSGNGRRNNNYAMLVISRGWILLIFGSIKR